MSIGGWLGGSWGEPIYYDYGDNLTYQDDVVYQDGEQVATAADYARQAATLASTTSDVDPEKAEWMPLGTFAIVREEKSEPTMYVQLAVSKDGQIAGSYSNAVTNSALDIEGHVDRKSQRAAWWIGDKRDTVMETGIFNLTKDQTQVLVHFGTDKIQTWLMVRLESPDGKK